MQLEYSFREIKMPSGATLKIQAAPFAQAKTLYQAILEETKAIDFKQEGEVGNLIKTAVMTVFSSRKVEEALWACLPKCLYNSGQGDLKIDKDTFEPLMARGDYVLVCVEVGKENILPFMSGLYAVWSELLGTIESARK